MIFFFVVVSAFHTWHQYFIGISGNGRRPVRYVQGAYVVVWTLSGQDAPGSPAGGEVAHTAGRNVDGLRVYPVGGKSVAARTGGTRHADAGVGLVGGGSPGRAVELRALRSRGTATRRSHRYGAEAGRGARRLTRNLLLVDHAAFHDEVDVQQLVDVLQR